ncbi:MAG: hypothetical protein WBO44_02340, partial [Saprospiraceae bacterium]
MDRRIILTFLLAFGMFAATSLILAQTPTTDSIRQKLAAETDPASQTRYYYLIAKELLEKHFDQAAFYTDSLERYAQHS